MSRCDFALKQRRDRPGGSASHDAITRPLSGSICAIMLALCAELSWNIGMPACGVVSATVNAVPIIPGVVAISTNVSDFEFGEVYPARVA